MSAPTLSPADRKEARELIEARVRSSSRAAVAARLGYSRAAVSRLLSGTYGDPDRLLRKALRVLGAVACPYTGRDEPRSLCAEQAQSEPPTHNPYRLAHWHACQSCPQRPETDK